MDYAAVTNLNQINLPPALIPGHSININFSFSKNQLIKFSYYQIQACGIPHLHIRVIIKRQPKIGC